MLRGMWVSSGSLLRSSSIDFLTIATVSLPLVAVLTPHMISLHLGAKEMSAKAGALTLQETLLGICAARRGENIGTGAAVTCLRVCGGVVLTGEDRSGFPDICEFMFWHGGLGKVYVSGM